MTNTPSSVCPLCPLNCDDLLIGTTGVPSMKGCAIVEKFRFDNDRGQTDLSIFRNDLRPLRAITSGVDLVIARELVRLESLGKIKLTIEADPSIDAMLETISRDGIVSATLAEVATRSDLIWLLGDVESTWPRFSAVVGLERLSEGSVRRKSQVSAEQLAEMFAASGSHWGDSKYAAVFIGPGAFLPGEESISSAFVARMVRQRNQAFRCVCVTLDQAATLRSVSLWSQNRSPNSSLDGQPDVRVGTPMNKTSQPVTVQIGGQDWGDAFAESYVATSVAGIHHRSMAIRGDGTVSLPLTGSVASDLPTTVGILHRILGLD